MLFPCLLAAFVAAPALAQAPAVDWRKVATSADRERVKGLRAAWKEALGKARGAGHATDVSAGGALFHPDAALASPAPPPGDYRCKVTKLGGKGPGLLDYVAYDWFQCRVADEGGLLSLAKLDGSQRPVGFLFPADPGRMIFLGTMMLSDERHARQYGADPERDMAGALERIGRARWRLVLPYPRWESTLDVVEMVPAGAG